MPTPRDLFDSLTLEDLQRWVAEQQQEDLRLDFKAVAGGSTLNRDDRNNLTEAVSGFANSDGGLIVWGVDARKNQEGVDAAGALRPIGNVAAVLSQLREHPGQLTSPIVDGVEHRLIEGEQTGTGYLVTYVPRSDRGPHMAMDKRYYKRNGTSFLRMEHFDVADMFGRRQRPDVRLYLERENVEIYAGLHKYRLKARLVNEGKARAREFKVIVTWPKETLGWESTRDQYAGDRQPVEHFQTRVPLFPGEEMRAGFSDITYHMSTYLYDRFRRGKWPTIDVVIYQDDAPLTRYQLSFQDFQNF